MNFQEYYGKLNLVNAAQIQITHFSTFVTYEEVFKWKWGATKLKIFSFLAYSGEINKQQIESYSKECLRYAIKNKKGLPRGWQNGVVANNVLVSERVTADAIAFVTSRPDKHFSAFEMPGVYDLSSGSLYFYSGGVIWGAVYDKFIQDYISDKFNKTIAYV